MSERTTAEYRNSLADTENQDMFSLGYQWADKPHRHVYDLCKMVDARDTEIARLTADVARLREALTPSGETKAAYIGEFTFRQNMGLDEDGADYVETLTVPWTTIKEIMKAISARAALGATDDK